ncbi:MAG: hypothetical protein AB1696_01500 [Planctomycetota bacterium]
MNNLNLPQFGGYLLQILLIVCSPATYCPTASLAQEPARWLNVRDLGASGSAFETTATTTAGSNQIAVKDVGDFQVGQGVMVSKCNVRYEAGMVRGPGEPYLEHRPMKGLVELRGFDGSGGDWLVFLLDIDGDNPLTFRWSDDLCRTWKAAKLPVTYDWQKLSGGLEVKFNRWEWKPGHFAHFSARTQLVSTIEKIEGKTLTLKHPANRTVTDAVVRHCDDQAIQAAIDRAVKEKRNVHVPVGHYRLSQSLRVWDADICIEGASGVDTLMDITDGAGAVFHLRHGTDVTIRNFRMIGHTPLSEKPATLHTATGFNFWCCAMKPCSAVNISATERVLVENVHASHMASECFISGGSYRDGDDGPKPYTRSATFLRCSVTNCAANAFNNCDFGENTSILYFRIDGAGWHAYEGSGRFLRLIGNYVRNAGPFTVGDIPHTLPRLERLHSLGVGQTIVANNVFEGIGRCGGIAINHCPTQVIVANNLFINYNGAAIRASSQTVHNTYPPQNISISGNIIDMTYSGDDAAPRTGIAVYTSDTTVSDNQIYVRGPCDPKVTGIQLREGAVNVTVHDNLIRNCGRGLLASRLPARVAEVLDPQTFLQTGLPLEWRHSHLYRNWGMVWLQGSTPAGQSVIDAFDPATLRFKLKGPRDMKAGDAFEAFPPSANWNVHDNTIAGCGQPVLLDCYGSETTTLRDNLIARGDAAGVQHAVKLSGRVNLLGNCISGFDEKGSSALGLYPDALGRAPRNLYRGNVFDRCAEAVMESRKGLWDAALSEGNTFVGCGATPPTAPASSK